MMVFIGVLNKKKTFQKWQVKTFEPTLILTQRKTKKSISNLHYLQSVLMEH